MTNALKAAGIGKEILDMIPDIIHTCRECRAWASAGSDTIPSITLAIKFNEYVEVDLMFYKQLIIFHLICRATRWHASSEVENREEDTLLDALDRIWSSIHGPMKFLISDGEGGLTNERVKAMLMSKGIEVKTRAPEQHARFIERGGAILRHAMHTTEEQCIRESVPIRFKS